jgi:hypothetical protein
MGDPRIVSIIPVVAPVANIVPQMNEQFEFLKDRRIVLIV